MSHHERVNILLVDDQPGKLLTYEAILGELGETLIKAGSGREALEQLLKREIAVVLVDVCMPDLDGFELAAMIREHPRFQRTAIIFVSAVAMTDLDRLRGYEVGAVDYVPVPVVPELLRAKVRIFAELYRKTRQLEALNAELEQRVAERTAELERANAELERRVEERTREREAALAQVHEMQKLESLGQLTGGLAHDFNNLLMAVLGNLELLSKRLPDDPRMRRLVDGAMQAAQRGAALTQRMLAFARRQELKPEAVEVEALVAGMMDMLCRSLGPTVQISTQFQPSLPATRVDRNQLELALLNLALNGRDAMPLGGHLAITGRRERVGERGPQGVQGLAPGDYLCIAVTDTGCGMDGETLRRAAEPFYTTKGVGKGTGLGLSMVHGLAAQSGGAMRIESRIGVGTTVEIWLPVVEEEGAAAPERSPGAAVGSVRRLRVLLVDDDAMIRTSTTDMLEDLGHQVIAADSGALALSLLRTERDVDVVLTDHAMPGMSGVELAGHIRQARPELPVILTTGFADLPAGGGPGLPRLDKPYTQDDLARLINALVGKGGGADVVPLSAARRA